VTNGTHSHHAAIIHADNTVTLVAGGTKVWCYEQLVDYCCVNPLADEDDALVLARSQVLEMRDLKLRRQKMAAERNMIIMDVKPCDVEDPHAEHSYDYEGPWQFCRGEGKP
jgi:hypothetical protein